MRTIPTPSTGATMFEHLKRLFASLSIHEVKYVMIGGIAAIVHGVGRATFDLDLLIEATHDNARCFLDAMTDAGLSTASLISAEQLLERELTIFRDHVQVDVRTAMLGVSFTTAWNNRVQERCGGETFYALSLQDLITSKRAIGRRQDIADAEVLEAFAREEVE